MEITIIWKIRWKYLSTNLCFASDQTAFVQTQKVHVIYKNPTTYIEKTRRRDVKRTTKLIQTRFYGIVRRFIY